MTIHTRIRTLAAALLALTVAGMSAGLVNAEPKQPVDNGVRCASYEPTTGEWEFYLPGEVVTTIDDKGVGHRKVCGADGEWHAALRLPTAGVRPLRPVSGGVLALP